MTPEQLAALVAERDALKAELARAMAEIESLDAECDSRHERFLAAVAERDVLQAEVARLSVRDTDALVDTSHAAVMTIVNAISGDGDAPDARMQAAEMLVSLLCKVARLSTPPDDAEAAALVKALRDTADHAVFAPSLHHIAADALTRLSHALAAETVKREAMEKALRMLDSQLASYGYQADGVMRDAARATLAKHGSKT